MASANHNSFIPPLLNCSCPPQATKLSSHTIIGRRCLILSYVDLGNGFHFSQTPHYVMNYAQNSSALFLNSHFSPRDIFVSPTTNSEINTFMARTCHRLRSRRGGSRGSNIYPLQRPTLNLLLLSLPLLPLIPVVPSLKYPDTCSGRGRSQAHGAQRVNTSTQTDNLPTPPHPSHHTNQFHFESTLLHPIIITTVIVTFNEEFNLQDEQEAQTHDLGPEKRNSGEQ